MIAYEQQLDADVGFALREGSMHFEDSSKVHQTLRAITRKLNERNIPYSVVGGMALYLHGFRRFTEDVDILVTRPSMQRIVDELEGLGYVQPPGTSTKLRDTATGVRIEFLISGQYPGDGKPKPVSFPDPLAVSIERDGISCLNLPTIVQLKLASGMSAAHRLKDLADVQELIRVLKLPKDMADQLDASVRDKYLELWTAIAEAPAEE